MPTMFSTLKEKLQFDSAFWREVMLAGIKHGPEAFVKYSPPLFGIAFGLALPLTRRRVQANLEHILGPRPAAQEALEVAAVFSNYAHCLTEAMLAGADRGYVVNPRTFRSDYYYDCIADGRGVIIATAHTGGWDVAGSMLQRGRNRDVYVVMARERDSNARKIQDQMRMNTGVHLVHIGESPFDALPLLRHLKDNSLVAMQVDRAPANMRARTVKLLDKPWRVPEGPLRLAATSGAPLLPVFTRRVDFLQYESFVHPPIRLSRRASSSELDDAAQKLMDYFGEFLRKNPTQWFDFAREEPDATTAAPP